MSNSVIPFVRRATKNMSSPGWTAGREASLSSLLNNPLYHGVAVLPLMYNDITLHYIALWTLVFGATLVWAVMHLKRNKRIRQTVRDGEMLRMRIRNILQHSREILFGFDLRSGRFDYLSPACLSLTGFTIEEIKAMGPRELLQRLHPDDRDEMHKLIDQLRQRKKESEWLGPVDYRFLHRDGQYRSFSDHLHVTYDDAGGAAYAGGSVRDVTRIVRLEESMRILERKFQDTQKMAGLGLLASGIAHDFNNLLTVILGNAELALLDCGGTDGGVLDEIKQTALRAAELANQMLVYTGKTSLVVSSINLCSAVKEMGSLLDVSISKKVSIQYCLAENVPFIRGDVSQIRQVAMNLITNASEAIGDRSGVIAISIHAVELQTGELERTFPPGGLPAGRYVRLEVSDTGDGMNEETMQKIFDPLFTTKITGRGLGLASLLNVVQRHNGAVDVKSEVGRGTVFRVYFPVEEQAGEQCAEETPAANGEWRGYGTALVADDEEAVRNITTALLERLGFRVITSADGVETVDLYTEHAGEISLLLMDLNMPRLNGIEATLRIRHVNPQVPVLFMSGYPREQVMERFGQQPHTDFIRKPFQTGELLAGIRHVIEARCD
ncbi:MAG: response regulator [Kiritimatiellales bacterium]